MSCEALDILDHSDTGRDRKVILLSLCLTSRFITCLPAILNDEKCFPWSQTHKCPSFFSQELKIATTWMGFSHRIKRFEVKNSKNRSRNSPK